VVAEIDVWRWAEPPLAGAVYEFYKHNFVIKCKVKPALKRDSKRI
jgi:hypothetical protein